GDLASLCVVAAGVFVVVGGGCFAPDPASGGELVFALGLMRGELLYVVFFSLPPPFSPYFHSFLYRIFGAHLDVLQMAGAICAVLVVWMCYRIARRLMTPSESALAVIAVILVCVFEPASNLVWS